MNFASGLAHAITCPCCHIPFYENSKSIDEAILIGEAATLFNHIPPHLLSTDVVIGAEERLRVNQINKVVTDKLESALVLNSTNFNTLYSLFLSGSFAYKFLLNNNELSENVLSFIDLK